MRQPFAESISSSRVSSRALSRASHVSNRGGGSTDLDDAALNFGDGTQRLEDIFNNITAGTTGPSLAEETFRASQHQQSRQQQPPHLSHTHPAQNRPFNPAPPNRNNPSSRINPPPPNPPSMSKEQADFEAAQFALKQAKMVSSAVSSITGTIKKEQLLQPDGSNFGQWTRLLREIGLTHLSDKDFFFKSCGNLSFERIGRAVILASVHISLVSDLQDLNSAHAMAESATTKFQTFSRAAQMNIWYQFMNFSIDPNAPTAGIATKLKDLYTSLKAINVRMSSDAFLVFILQSAIMSSSAGFCHDFEQRVELAIQHDPKSNCPTFPFLLNLFDICRQQHHQHSQHHVATTVLPSNDSLLMMSAPDTSSEFDASAYLADVNEQDWPDALDFFAVTAHKCWHCGGENHYARDCPNKSQMQKKSKAIGTFVGTIYGQLPSGFQVTSSRFPNLSQRCMPSLPNNTQQQARRLADYYRPRYSQTLSAPPGQCSQPISSAPRASVSAQAVEVNGLPDDLDDLDFNSMAIGEDLVSNPAIFDTGASHGFTGSKSFLHNFRPLCKPIPVSVATNGAGSVISGFGDLKFMLPNGNIIVLCQILYCEQAKATLLSMAALRKANAQVSYDNATDSFLISNKDGTPLFECPFESKRNRWILPHRFIPCNDPSANGRLLYQFHHVSSDVANVSNKTLSEEPIVPTSLDSLDTIDDVSHANKKSRILKPPTTDNVLSPDELADYFKQPVLDLPGYKWQAESLNQLPAGKIHCPVCAISKSTRINPLASTNREIERMDILAVDLIGPFQVDSVDGGKYIMTMRDVATGYCFVRVLTHKWEATGHIVTIIDKVENFTEKKVKILRSNNGGEFVNNELKAYLDGKGIIAERALPYHHYQNGVIERFNRTVAAMARTILLDSSLPKTFWSYAFMWAAHTLNRVPNKASGKITPLEAFLRHKPQFGIFRVFGSIGYAHIPHELRKKLDVRAHQGHVVAYLGVSKGWHLWIPDENCFIESAMVRFPDELKDVPTTTASKAIKHAPEGSKSSSAGQNVPATTTPATADPPPVNKMSIQHVMNLMRLGDFTDEFVFHDQELIVDKIIELCQFYNIAVPNTFKQAMKSEAKDEWLKAIAVELNNLEEMRVWALGQLPPGKKELNGRWVFATKPDVGEGVRYKARFVAKGFTQVAGVDFNATFAPTATFVSLRLLLTVAAANKWPVHSFDFVAAYLNSPIDEEIWIKPPEGMSVPTGHVLKLEKALYGTRQAARCWWIHLRDTLAKLNYIPSQYDNSLYILRHPD
ncbi:hypothetical protein PCASD_19134 [Puccinia coronata f. sp. avenae]|uniref:Integrase catalytic domain-containing protein n=1 Tax=Puccinia coronata f. sp. avenae TaxID=200324 RepID=A0A2N5TSH2_9BASI|nr:hypothetical protein PCASD_19134 [Puccinia coronata f. sp. avenae]